MGVLLDCLHCLAMTVDKYTVAHKFYSWHHHCCGNFSCLEGYNILFLSYHCLPVRQHSHLQIRPQDTCGKEPFCVPGLSEKYLETQEEEIWGDESPGMVPSFLPNNLNKWKMWKNISTPEGWKMLSSLSKLWGIVHSNFMNSAFFSYEFFTELIQKGSLMSRRITLVLCYLL